MYSISGSPVSILGDDSFSSFALVLGGSFQLLSLEPKVSHNTTNTHTHTHKDSARSAKANKPKFLTTRSTAMIMNSQPHALALVAALLVALVVPPFSGVFTTVQAFSTGAGQCLVGQVSVGSPHLPDTQGDNGTLAGIAIEFLVDGTVVPDPSVPFALTPGLDHAVVLKATGKPLRGFLVAVSSPNDASLDLTSAIAPDTATGQIAGTCATPVVGITHKDNTDKTSVSGILRVDSAADLVLDITVVLQNSNGISSFGYTRFSASTAGVDTASPTR